MIFGSRRIVAALDRLLLPLRQELRDLRTDVRILKNQVSNMSAAQDQVLSELSTIRQQVATMLTDYHAAAAASFSEALAQQQAAWQADDDTRWQAAHAMTRSIIAAMAAGQPITPPPTVSNPNPAPVPAPAVPDAAPIAAPVDATTVAATTPGAATPSAATTDTSAAAPAATTAPVT